MKPLSNIKYYKHNKSKLLLIVIPLVLSIILIYTIHMIIVTYFNVQYNAFVETRKHYSSISARGKLIETDVISAIEDYENTEKTIPCVLGFTDIDGVVSSVGIRIYSLYQKDLKELLDKMRLELIAGRLPEPGKNEIIMHEAVLINKGLIMGDMIGNEVIENEKLLGKHEIVGIIKGKAIAGFTPLETWVVNTGIENPKKYGILIFAKKGKRQELNRYIDYLPLAGNQISSYTTSSSELKKSSERIYIILNTIYISLLSIVSMCLGFLTHLFYCNRLREFAILNVIGYSKHYILTRNIKEVIVINASSAIVGITVSIIIGTLLNVTFFQDMGIPLLLFDKKTIILSLCAPMLSIVAQTISIGIALNKMDMVSVMELENGGVV